VGVRRFLSCLCGSERLARPAQRLQVFLSCLCGSERNCGLVARPTRFSELPMRQ